MHSDCYWGGVPVSTFELPTTLLPPEQVAWVTRAAEALCELERADRLPSVSSTLSGAARALRRGEDQAPLAAHWFREAMLALSVGYAALLRALLPGLSEGRSPARVLSLCTGYDAALELLALRLAAGPLARYVSVDLDPLAAATNDLLTAGTPIAASVVHRVGDVRDLAAMRRTLDELGPFDACLVLRPPVFPTRYGDARSAARSRGDVTHAPIALELLLLKQDLLHAPLCLVTDQDAERERLHLLARTFGGDLRSVTHACPLPREDLPALTLRAAVLA